MVRTSPQVGRGQEVRKLQEWGPENRLEGTRCRSEDMLPVLVSDPCKVLSGASPAC